MADLNGTTVYPFQNINQRVGMNLPKMLDLLCQFGNNKFSEQSGRSGTVSAIFADPRREQLDDGVQIYPRGDGAIRVHID